MHQFGLVLVFALIMGLSACTNGRQGTPSEPATSPTSGSSSTTPAPTGALRPPPTPPETMCTAADCNSILAIEFNEVDIEPEATYTVDICVEDECVSETVTIDVPHPGTVEIDRGETERHRGSPEGRMLVWADDDRIDFFLPDQEYGETAHVSLSLTTSDGDVLAAVDNEDVPLQRSQPNGFGCLPICFSGRLTI